MWGSAWGAYRGGATFASERHETTQERFVLVSGQRERRRNGAAADLARALH
jgi:hypothetical protein